MDSLAVGVRVLQLAGAEGEHRQARVFPANSLASHDTSQPRMG